MAQWEHTVCVLWWREVNTTVPTTATTATTTAAAVATGRIYKERNYIYI